MSRTRRPFDPADVPENILEALVRSAPVAILILDLDMRVAMWNPACERIFGWTAEEILGEPYPLVPDEEWEAFEGFFQRVIRGDGFTGVEARRRRKDGTRLYIAVSTAPIRDATGAVIGAMAILEDITERKLLEEHFRQSQKMEAVGRLAGGIAHDFNNVLTVILSYCDALLLAGDPSRARKDLIAIQRAAERAADLTRQLLAFSRRQVLQVRLVDLNSLLRSSVDLLSRLIGEDIQIRLDLDPTIGPVRADPAQLERLLLNLAANARDAMPKGGVMTLKTGRTGADEYPALGPGRWVGFCVCDTGEGMPPEVLNRVFEPFFTTKELGRGTGLGLASVYGIVLQSGGEVDVRSAPGEGTEFRVFFPEAADHGPQPEPDPAGERHLGRGLRVLVAEDDDQVREVVHRTLVARGFTVVTAAGGEEAIALAAESDQAFDLLLTDVVMPGMNGRQLAERLTRARPDTRVLYMSGYTDDELLRRGVERGAAFLHKPFTPQELLEAIGRVLEA